MKQNKGFLNTFFELDKRNTNVRTEILAGITSFITMSYIIIVNPQILADAGIPIFNHYFNATNF
jgi:AGZA family xanthine/uracil permease-like MFS transporter